ncbi:MAG: acetolactate synthase small subunit [Hydrotalea sp.]|nr:acetolactate synthase small subunit [Hydrotalea sp.]
MAQQKKNKSDDAPASVYELAGTPDKTRFHTLAVMVDNEPGVLARVVGLFSGRGYNIESLTVSAVGQHHHLSRITLVTSGTEKTIRQIKSQLARLIPVHDVHDLTTDGNFLSGEMAMVKLLLGKNSNLAKIISQVEKKGAVVIKKSAGGVMFCYSGNAPEVEQFCKWVHDMSKVDKAGETKVELVRSGVIALSADMKPNHLVDSND